MANYCYKVMFGTLVLGLIAFLIVNVRQHVLAQGQLKLVRTLTGPVRGERRVGTVLDQPRPYYAFRGIPYAAPPVGALRFRPAQPARPWKAVRSCYEHAPICMQINDERRIVGEEDCLYLNVYTPEVDPEEEQRRAVLVWLPGDDWFSGSGNVDRLGPEFLIEQDVIVVTVNYRLGVLGFLNLDEMEAPGNQGLGDQQLALEWIVENVHLFGGDPKRVSLGGAGAGSLAVQLHMYADRSAGLFRSAVQLAGNGFGQWATFERVPLVNVRAELLTLVRRPLAARRVTNADLLNELLTVEATALVEAFSDRTHAWLGPSAESTAPVEFPFLAGRAAQLLDWRLEMDATWTTTKSVLAGYGTAEAQAILSAQMFELFRANASAALWTPFNQQSRKKGRVHTTMTSTLAAQWPRIEQRYIADAAGSRNATREEFVRLLSDLHVRYLVDRRLRYVAERTTGKVWRYRFGLETQLNLQKRWVHKEFNVEGTAHADEMCYVFRCESVSGMYENVTVGSVPYRHIVAMSSAVGRFVRDGTPAVQEWRPMRVDGEADEFFVDMTMDGWLEGVNEFGEERAFWEEMVGLASKGTEGG